MNGDDTNADGGDVKLSRAERKRRFKAQQLQAQQDAQNNPNTSREASDEKLVKRLRGGGGLLALANDSTRRPRRCIIEYDGTNFQGFQAQNQSNERRTVQETIENAITRTTGESVRVKGCSRTDKGVHARGQVIVFASACEADDRTFRDAINTRLPDDIVCRSLQTLPVSESGDVDAFDPRANAVGKIYEYVIVTGSVRPVLDRHSVWSMNKSLDIDRMRAAAAHFTSEPVAKDYSAFTPAKSSQQHADDGNSTVCSLYSITILEDSHAPSDDGYEDDSVRIRIRFHGDRFLYKMVRNLVGTLVDVGRGRIEPDIIPTIIQTKDRSKAGQGAPPHGLTLVRVLYKDDNHVQ